MRVPSVRPRRSLVLGIVLAVALASASISAATFSIAAGGGSMAISSATLLAPTGVGAVQTNCKNNAASKVTVSWTATSSTFATGYTIQRATVSAGPYATVGTVAFGTNSFLNSTGLAYSTTYYYQVLSTYRSWTATSSTVSVKTKSRFCA